MASVDRREKKVFFNEWQRHSELAWNVASTATSSRVPAALACGIKGGSYVRVMVLPEAVFWHDIDGVCVLQVDRHAHFRVRWVVAPDPVLRVMESVRL